MEKGIVPILVEPLNSGLLLKETSTSENTLFPSFDNQYYLEKRKIGLEPWQDLA